MAEAFGEGYESAYGHRAGPEEPVELVNVELIGQGLPERSRIPERLQMAEATMVCGERKACFGMDHSWITTPVIGRSDLTDGVDGPAIAERFGADLTIDIADVPDPDERKHVVRENTPQGWRRWRGLRVCRESCGDRGRTGLPQTRRNVCGI